MELKSRITEMKISLQGFNKKLSKQKKESMNLKIGQLRFFNLRSRKKKTPLDPQRPVGYNQAQAQWEIQKEKRERMEQRVYLKK